MSINSYGVLDTFEDFFNEVASSFAYLYGDPSSSYKEPFPPTNQSIDKETRTLYLEMGLAGYSEEELSLEISNDTLTIKGNPKTEKDDKRIIHQRIKKMTFTRKYSLPAGVYDTSQAKATFENGLLSIVIPAKKKSEALKIAINSKD